MLRSDTEPVDRPRLEPTGRAADMMLIGNDWSYLIEFVITVK